MGPLSTREVGAKFAELIYADPQWLRAEFDALISAGYGAPPAWPRLPAPPRVPPGGPKPGPPTRPWRPAVPAAGPWIALRPHHRERSPP
jgi:hypothetical protein